MVLLRRAAAIEGDTYDIDLDRDATVDIPALNLEKELLISSMRGKDTTAVQVANYVAKRPTRFLFIEGGRRRKSGEDWTYIGDEDARRAYAADVLWHFCDVMKTLDDNHVVSSTVCEALRKLTGRVKHSAADVLKDFQTQITSQNLHPTAWALYQRDALSEARSALKANFFPHRLSPSWRMLEEQWSTLNRVGNQVYVLTMHEAGDPVVADGALEDFHEWMFQRAMDYAEKANP